MARVLCECGMFTGMRAFLVFAMLLWLTQNARSQDCPREAPKGPPIDSVVKTLTGKVVFHNDLRQWLSLELPDPVCGARTIELIKVGDEKDPPEHLEVFRGCMVTVTGVLGLPMTGYYSAEIYQQADGVRPAKGCRKKPAFVDLSESKPDSRIRSYQVKMWFDYTPQEPVHATIGSGQQQLHPWQAYAHYFLTGGFVFYASCADEFAMSRLRATPQSHPEMIDKYAAIDPETAAEKHVRRIWISYLCRR